MRRHVTSKSETCTGSRFVNATGISVKVVSLTRGDPGAGACREVSRGRSSLENEPGGREASFKRRDRRTQPDEGPNSSQGKEPGIVRAERRTEGFRKEELVLRGLDGIRLSKR